MNLRTFYSLRLTLPLVLILAFWGASCKSQNLTLVSNGISKYEIVVDGQLSDNDLAATSGIHKKDYLRNAANRGGFSKG